MRTKSEGNSCEPSEAHNESFAPTELDDWDDVKPRSPGTALDRIAGGHAGVVLISDTAPIDPAEGQAWLDTGTTGPPATAYLTVVTITGNTTLDADDTVVLCDASGGAFTVTLPAAAANETKRYFIKKIDSTSNAVTIDANGSETIDGQTTQVITIQYNSPQIVSDGAQWWIL